MHLIGSLCSGINGAANGTVDIFRRGTTVRVTCYADFEGSSSMVPSAALALDANGGLVVFVNELVLCVVRDSGGVILRTFVAGDSASAIEVISDSFTGVDYATAISAVSKPIALQALLDKWNNSAGAADFSVLFGGVPRTLSAAFAVVGGFYFNVKSTDYGAVGDGTTDDSAAIASAITACAAAGGGVVFFPAGTYRLAAPIGSGAGTITLLGAGYGSVIKNDMPATGSVAFGGSGRVESLRFECAQANASTLISCTSGELVVRNCWFNDGGLHTGTSIGSTAPALLTVQGCAFTLAAAGRAVDSTAGGASRAVFLGNRVTASLSTYVGTILALGNVAGITALVAWNTFDLSFVTVGGAITVVAFTDAPAVVQCSKVLVGNQVAAPVGVGAVVVTFYSVTAAGAFTAAYQPVVAFGNSAPNCAVSIPLLTSIAANHQGMLLSERISNKQYTTFNGAFSAAADPSRYAYIEVESSSVAVSAPVFGQPPSVGLDLVYVWYQNNGGGSGLVTFDAFVKGIASFTVNANSVSYYFFRSVERGNSTRKWALVGSAVNLTP